MSYYYLVRRSTWYRMFSVFNGFYYAYLLVPRPSAQGITTGNGSFEFCSLDVSCTGTFCNNHL